jgi:phosphate butyryltransferase
MIQSFDQLLDAVRDLPCQTIAIGAANSDVVIEGAKAAFDLGIAHPLLFGDARAITELAARAGLDLSAIEVQDVPDDIAATAAAVAAVRDGRAQILVKGHIHTDDFLRCILDADRGLRSGLLMSHVFVLEHRARGRLLFVTDGAMNIAPDLQQKAQIILNAVYLSRAFGLEQPKVGVLAAVEVVNPKMPVTIDAAALAGMGKRGQFPFCCIDGPFALDNAVSPEAARIKGISGPVAGLCDILLAPDIEVGNILAKSFAFLCGGRTAGLLIGAVAPVVLTSRADSAEARLFSIAAAVLTAGMSRDGRLKMGRVHY